MLAFSGNDCGVDGRNKFDQVENKEGDHVSNVF
jgi:hypothetical protein